MGFSQTPTEVWLCDRSEAVMYDGDFASTEFEDRGQNYYRPETREMFSEDEGAWRDVCDGSERQQVVLTDYGCKKAFANEDKANSAIWFFDIDSQEISTTKTLLSDEIQFISVTNYTNCKVVSPLLFEWTVQVNFVELTNHERRREDQNLSSDAAHL